MNVKHPNKNEVFKIDESIFQHNLTWMSGLEPAFIEEFIQEHLPEVDYIYSTQDGVFGYKHKLDSSSELLIGAKLVWQRNE